VAEALVNGVASTLNGAITNSQTTITIASADASKFPASGTGNYRVAVTDNTNTELMLVTSGHGTATLTVTRAAESYNGSSTARAFASGSTVAQVLTAAGASTLGLAPFANQPILGASTAYDDEFEDLSGQSGPANGLAGKWGFQNLTSASYTLSNTAPSCLNFNGASGLSGSLLIREACPSGDFVVHAFAEFLGFGDRQIWALCIVDSSGTGVGMCWDGMAGGGTAFRIISAWAASTPVTIGSLTPFGATTLRVRKSGTTYYGNLTSGFGSRIRTIADNWSFTGQSFTPAYIAFGRTFGTGTFSILLDAIRQS